MTGLKPEVRYELLKRAEAEQALRAEWGDSDNEELRLKVLAQDTENTIFLKKLIKGAGWPKITKVGKEAAMAAWLIAQHSPDKDFRRLCLELMQEAPDEVEPHNIARTIDRVRIEEGKQQYFGTHFMKSEDGTWIPMPIEDEEHVEQRRADYGLPTIAEKINEYNK